jgi:phage terminase small subunit
VPVKQAKKAIPPAGRTATPAPKKSAESGRSNLPQPGKREAPTLRLQMFVDAYIQTFNATKAAEAAGYTPTNAASAGSTLLKDGRVQEMLSRTMVSRMGSADVRTVDILQALMEIAYIDPAEYLELTPTSNGRFTTTRRQFLALPRAARRCVKEWKDKRTVDKAGRVTTVVEMKLHDKLRALDLLAQHRGLLKTVVEHHVTFASLEKLPDADLAKAHREELEKYERHLAARARLRSGLATLPAANTEEEE